MRKPLLRQPVYIEPREAKVRTQIASIGVAALCIVWAYCAAAATPNTSAAGAVSYEVGQGWVSHGVDETGQNRWFSLREVAGRSYCVEAALGTATYLPLDPNLNVYQDSAGTTVLFSNNDGASEPPQNKGARVCYPSPLALTAAKDPTPQVTTVRLFMVNVPIAAGSGDSGFVRVRVLDTTLWAESYKVTGSGFGSADTLVHVANSSNARITGSFYLAGYGQTGTITVGLQSQKEFNLSTLMTVGSMSSFSGAVYFLHNGAPGAITGWVQYTSGSTQYTYGLDPR
jgi:hypothetical protein